MRVEFMGVGNAIPYSEVRIAGDDDAPLAGRDASGNIYIRGRERHAGLLRESRGECGGAHARTAGCAPATSGVVHDGELYITGRAKEIIFVNGQNYYPHDLENIAQRAEGLELGKVVAAGAKPRGAQTEQLVVFVLHRGDMKDFLPTRHAGVAAHQREHRARSGGSDSGEAHSEDHQRQDPAAPARRELRARASSMRSSRSCARCARRSAGRPSLFAHGHRGSAEERSCDAALEGKRVDLHDNLFEIGASSLKLIEIHENIDREYPGLVDLTELFDFPTIAELAQHLETKLAARA